MAVPPPTLLRAVPVISRHHVTGGSGPTLGCGSREGADANAEDSGPGRRRLGGSTMAPAVPVADGPSQASPATPFPLLVLTQARDRPSRRAGSEREEAEHTPQKVLSPRSWAFREKWETECSFFSETIYTCACTHVCTHRHTNRHMCTQAYIQTQRHMCKHIDTYTCKQVHHNQRHLSITLDIPFFSLAKQ